jgi:hypothetical protein
MFEECKTAIASISDKTADFDLTASKQYLFAAKLQTRKILEVLIPEDFYHLRQIIAIIGSQQIDLRRP